MRQYSCSIVSACVFATTKSSMADKLTRTRHGRLNERGLTATPDQKGVDLDRLFRRALADDGFVFDAPELRIAVPAIERLAVEDGFKPRVIVQRQRLDARATTTTLTTRRAALPLWRARRLTLLSN